MTMKSHSTQQDLPNFFWGFLYGLMGFQGGDGEGCWGVWPGKDAIPQHTMWGTVGLDCCMTWYHQSQHNCKFYQWYSHMSHHIPWTTVPPHLPSALGHCYDLVLGRTSISLLKDWEDLCIDLWGYLDWQCNLLWWLSVWCCLLGAP